MNDKQKRDYIKRYEAAKVERIKAVDFLFANNLILSAERKTILERIEGHHLSKIQLLETSIK